MTAPSQVDPILNQPAIGLSFGPRALEKRRVASRWRKALYVVSPLVVTPLAAGVGTTVGALVLGAAAGALMPGMGFNTGIVYGSIAAFQFAPMATLAATVASVVQATSRMRISRTALAQKLDARQHGHAGRTVPRRRPGM